ncbi:hypothetical protein AB0O75_24505 [Streptomyces sp. NPDC088921]|uniref:hypothetical protein n=1 Tax=unclassified Streptomyces TaxID=2593676 RepID=UPI0034315EAF
MARKLEARTGHTCVLVPAALFGVFALLYVLDDTFTDYSWSAVGQHLVFMAAFLLIASGGAWLWGRRRR